jgi:hypothetical protein
MYGISIYFCFVKRAKIRSFYEFLNEILVFIKGYKSEFIRAKLKFLAPI